MTEYQRKKDEQKMIEEEIGKHEGLVKEAEARIVNCKSAMKENFAIYQAAMAEGDIRKVQKLEAEEDKIKLGLKRDEAFIAGTKNKICDLQVKLTTVVEERDKALSEQASKWIAGEVQAFDKVAREMRGRVCRLLASQHLLRDAGLMEVYRAGVGEGYAHLPLMRIPILSEYDISVFRDYKGNRLTTDVMEAVEKEITGK